MAIKKLKTCISKQPDQLLVQPALGYNFYKKKLKICIYNLTNRIRYYYSCFCNSIFGSKNIYPQPDCLATCTAAFVLQFLQKKNKNTMVQPVKQIANLAALILQFLSTKKNKQVCLTGLTSCWHICSCVTVFIQEKKYIST